MVQFLLRPGNVAEGKELPTLLAGVPLNDTRELLGDKAYDSNAVRALLASLDIAATIPSKANRKEPIWFDQGSYQGRHLVENAFRARKQFRGIACRYAKLADGTVTFCWGNVRYSRCRTVARSTHRALRHSTSVRGSTPLPIFRRKAG